MKYILIITAFLICAAINCKAQSDMEYTFPDDITENNKEEFAKQFKKGNILYKMNCAKCHTNSIDDKEIIPDFSLPQLLDYEIRFAYPDHQDPMREVNISKEELDRIILFLQYKKRNDSSENQNE